MRRFQAEEIEEMELDTAADDDGGWVGGMTDAQSQSGEVQAGTLRYLLIRPVGRTIWLPGYRPGIF